MNAKKAKKYRFSPHEIGAKYANKTGKDHPRSPLIGLWVLFTLIFMGFLFWPAPYTAPSDLPVKYEIQYPSELHKSSNAETSAMTIIQGLFLWKNGLGLSPEELAKAQNTWRIHKGAYTGFALQELLNTNNIATKTLRGARMSNDERIQEVQSNLRDGNPVIIMGGKSEQPSYLLVLGYNRVAKTFEVYDPVISHDISNITYDNNNEFTGNMTYSNDDLLSFWSKGRVFGFYNHYGIVIDL